MKRLIILLLLLTACKSKQITTQTKEVTRTDTIYKFQDRIIDRPVIDSIIIEKPCDSLGRLKPFSGILKTNHSKVSVKADNGKLAVLFKQDSITTEKEKEYHSQKEVKNENIKHAVIKYRCSWKLWLWAISATIGFLFLMFRSLQKMGSH